MFASKLWVIPALQCITSSHSFYKGSGLDHRTAPFIVLEWLWFLLCQLKEKFWIHRRRHTKFKFYIPFNAKSFISLKLIARDQRVELLVSIRTCVILLFSWLSLSTCSKGNSDLLHPASASLSPQQPYLTEKVTKSTTLSLPHLRPSLICSTSFVNFPGVVENKETKELGSCLPVVSTTCTTWETYTIVILNQVILL